MTSKKISSGVEIYNSINAKRWSILFFTLLSVFFSLLVDLGTGSSNLTPLEVLQILWNGPNVKDANTAIIWEIRLPMTLICLVVGASLGLAGAQMQTILFNPLASPYTLGISSAAGFGAAISFIVGFPFTEMSWLNAPIMAFSTTMIAVGAIYLLGKKKGVQTQSMILFGIVIHFFFQALLSLVQFRSTPEVAGQIIFWMYGSLVKATWIGVAVSGVIFIISAILLSRYVWQLTTLSTGEDRARSLGVNTDALKLRVFIISAFLTAGAVSFVGTIGFIGLVAPHFSRFFVGEDQRFFAPLSSIFGILLIAIASIVGKLVVPGVIVPIGIVTALIGVPFLMYLIIKRSRE